MTTEENDNLIINNWNKTVNKRDLTFILGDISMEKKEPYILLDKLNGRKVIIGGNHDLWKHSQHLLKHVESIAGCINYKGFILTHIPIHEQEIDRFRGNIHGHIHKDLILKRIYKPPAIVKEIVDKRYLCVSCEQINYTPITLEELLNK